MAGRAGEFTPGPGTSGYFTLPIDQRAAAFRAAVAGGYDAKAENYFTEQEMQFLGALGTPADGEQGPLDLSSLFGGGGGGGTTIVYSAGSAPSLPQTPRTTAEAEQYVREHYGFMSWALDIPEVRQVLLDAAMKGWGDAELQGAIQKTEWWGSSTQASRAWDQFIATDPNSAWQQIAQTAPKIEGLLTRLGVDVTSARIREFTEKALRFGWSEQDIQRAAAAEMRWDPKRDLSGQFAEADTRIKARAADYALPVSDKGVFGLARRALMGEIDDAWVDDFLRDKAKKQYAHLADDLERGLTVKEIADPYIASAAQLLEIDPDTIDLAESKWRRAIASRGEDGKVAAMDLTDWQATVMNDQRYGWDSTRNAREAAVELVGQLAETFGVR